MLKSVLKKFCSKTLIASTVSEIIFELLDVLTCVLVVSTVGIVTRGRGGQKLSKDKIPQNLLGELLGLNEMMAVKYLAVSFKK